MSVANKNLLLQLESSLLTCNYIAIRNQNNKAIKNLILGSFKHEMFMIIYLANGRFEMARVVERPET